MGKLTYGALVAVSAVLGTACGQDNDHPKNQHFVIGGSGGGGGVGNSGGGGSGGGTPCTPDPTKGSSLSGNLITYDVFLTDKKPYPAVGEIKAQGANCPFVSTTWDGSASGGPDGGAPLFLLESVKADVDLWTYISQAPGSAEAVYPTLIRVDSSNDFQYIDGFGFIRAQGIDEAYAATGLTRDPDKGTMLVQLLAPLSNTPQPFGQVDVGVNGAPAYPGLSGWQLGGETDPSGVALMLNATAKPYPGQTLKVNVTLGAQKATFDCPAAPGAVTICWIGIGTG